MPSSALPAEVATGEVIAAAWGNAVRTYAQELATEAAAEASQLDTAQANIVTLQTDLDAAEADIATLQTDLNAAEASIVTLTTDLNTAEAAITVLQARAATWTANVDGDGFNLTDLGQLAFRSGGYVSSNLGVTGAPLTKLHVVGGSTTPGSELGSLLVTGASTSERLAMGYQTSVGAWIQSVLNGTSPTPLLLNPGGGGLRVNLDGTVKTLSIDGSGFVKAS